MKRGIFMFNDKKSYRKYILPVLVIVLLLAGFGKGKFQSVDSYKKEQKQIVKEIEKAEEKEDDQQQKEILVTKEPEKREIVLVTPSVTDDYQVRKETSDASDEKTVQATSEAGRSEKTKKSKVSKKSKNTEETKVPESTQTPNTNKVLPTKEPAKEPVTTKEPEKLITCVMTIQCTTLLDNLDALEENLHKYVPEDGYMVNQMSVSIKEGASAYELLEMVCKAQGIHLDATHTAVDSGYYVRGIGYLYEKNAGKMSGWLYKVNGEIPNKGASNYILQEGDHIAFVYTCNGGKDIK